jgi:hypothetical protein
MGLTRASRSLPAALYLVSVFVGVVSVFVGVVSVFIGVVGVFVCLVRIVIGVIDVFIDFVGVFIRFIDGLVGLVSVVGVIVDLIGIVVGPIIERVRGLLVALGARCLGERAALGRFRLCRLHILARFRRGGASESQEQGNGRC